MDMTGVRLTELVEAAGCAAKIAPGALAKVLGNLPRTEDPNLLVGFDASDDACVYDLGDGRGLVQTCDFFPPMVDDPFLFGQVAAANALSDVYAMGGEPKLALNLLCFPNCLGIEVAGQILAGGADRCQLAGCVVAGGHSINDHEPKYGLSVTGFVQLDGLLANAGAKVGDALVLTKGLGTGIITTAYKGGLLDEAGVRVATDSMIRLNDTVGRVGGDIVRHACTDVTGFSLMGHSCEMAEGLGRHATRSTPTRCPCLTARARWPAWACCLRAPTATATSLGRAFRWVPTCRLTWRTSCLTPRPPAACW